MVKNGQKIVRCPLGKAVEKNSWGTPLSTRGDPLPHAGLFFSLTPHSLTRGMELFFGPPNMLRPPARGLFPSNALQIWPQKEPLGPFWRSNLVPWQVTAPGRSVYCAPAWPGRALATRVHPAERSHLVRQPTGTVSTPCRKATQTGTSRCELSTKGG